MVVARLPPAPGEPPRFHQRSSHISQATTSSRRSPKRTNDGSQSDERIAGGATCRGNTGRYDSAGRHLTHPPANARPSRPSRPHPHAPTLPTATHHSPTNTKPTLPQPDH